MNENIEDEMNNKFKKSVWLDILKELLKEKKLFFLALSISALQGLLEVSTSFFTKYVYIK